LAAWLKVNTQTKTLKMSEEISMKSMAKKILLVFQQVKEYKKPSVIVLVDIRAHKLTLN